jgi:hypothetical protein
MMGDHLKMRPAQPAASPTASSVGLLKTTMPPVSSDFDPATLLQL